MKKIGQKVIASIDKKSYSKSMTDKEYTSLENKVKLYNKKATEAIKANIIKLLTPEETKKAKEKDDLKVKSKAIKKQIKKTSKTADKDTIEKKITLADIENSLEKEELTEAEIQALLNKLKKVEDKAPVEAPRANRGGENYRNYSDN